MCNIIILKPGQMPIREEFDTMCYNNWHAFGLVTFIDGKLDIVKKAFTDTDEINPSVIWSLLQKDIQYRRILHVRHMTAGTNTILNTHPYDVFHSDKRTVVFMHNGTLYNYKSKKKNETGQLIDDDSGPSDSKNFVDQVLTPYLSAMDFGNGHGDINHPLVLSLLSQFWTSGSTNRGILLSSDQEYTTLGTWVKRRDSAGGEYLSANDDYFTHVKRGPEHARREESRKKALKALDNKTTTTTGTNIIPITPMQSFPNIGKPQFGFFTVNDHFKNILQDWSIYDRENAVTVGAMTKEELLELMENKDDAIFLCDLIFTDYAQMYGELLETEAKHVRATKLIAQLQAQIAAEGKTKEAA